MGNNKKKRKKRGSEQLNKKSVNNGVQFTHTGRENQRLESYDKGI